MRNKLLIAVGTVSLLFLAAGMPFDFRQLVSISKLIGTSNQQLKNGKGFDIFCIQIQLNQEH
ncbi:hypothetical protein [Pedobacter sp. NJ-S-72]